MILLDGFSSPVHLQIWDMFIRGSLHIKTQATNMEACLRLCKWGVGQDFFKTLSSIGAKGISHLTRYVNFGVLKLWLVKDTCEQKYRGDTWFSSSFELQFCFLFSGGGCNMDESCFARETMHMPQPGVSICLVFYRQVICSMQHLPIHLPYR